MANPNPDTSGLKPFKKGDKRINRSGKPKSFDALRKLAQKIAASDLPANEKGEILTRIEATMTLMSTSRNPADRRLFLEYAFGKVKEEVALEIKDELTDDERIERLDALLNAARTRRDGQDIK